MEHDCVHSEDVILSCLTEGSLRLVRDRTPNTFAPSNAFVPFGRLEIFIAGDWGTVCDYRFTMTSANVACWQLGFSGAVSWTNIAEQK